MIHFYTKKRYNGCQHNTLSTQGVLVVLLFFFTIPAAFSQESESTLTGQIIDGRTQEPLPYATIFMKNHSLGATSDDKGMFRVHLPDSLLVDTIVFSYIGYDAFELIAKDVKENMEVKLFSDEEILDNVDVVAMTVDERIERIKSKIEENYLDTPSMMNAYYIERVKENGEIIFRTEAVVDLYRKSYLDETDVAQIRLIEGYIENYVDKMAFAPDLIKDFREDQIDKYKEKVDRSLTQIEKDSLANWHPVVDGLSKNRGPYNMVTNNDFVRYVVNGNPRRIQWWKDRQESMKFIGRSTFQGEDVSVLEVVSKRGTRTRVYLNDDEAVMSIQAKGKFKPPWYINSYLWFKRIGVEEVTFTFNVNYRPLGKKWYLHSVVGRVSGVAFNRNWFSANDEFEYDIVTLFTINSINTESANPFPQEQRLKNDVPFRYQLKPYNKSFWEAYHRKN